MYYKKALQDKFPNFCFDKFTATKSNEKSIVTCNKHGDFINCYKEMIRQVVSCPGCRKDVPRVPTELPGYCETHGDYIYHRYNSPNCKKCLVESRSDTHDNFLKKLGKTDFKVISTYEKSNKHILVEDKYGIMKVLPNHLLRGKKPGIMSALDKTNYCINVFKDVHGDKYDYSQVVYTKAFSPVTIICPFHGTFKQTPVAHKMGKQCTKCAYEALDIGFTLEDFIRVSAGRLCRLYLVEITTKDETFLKIGITSRSLKTRLNRHNYKVISLIEDLDPSFIYNREKFLHEKLKKFKFEPKVRFNGYKECYNVMYLNEIINEFRRV